MRCLLVFLCLILVVRAFSQDTTQHNVPGRKNAEAQKGKPYVILISADGFRYDYAEKFGAKNLLALSKNGVRADGMVPSYPSVTYPNHYSVATGMYPAHHGIVYNRFYDRARKEVYNVSARRTVEDGSWYHGIPLWVLAEQQGMITASYFYVGTEAPVQNTYSTYWYRYNSKAPSQQGIDAVVNWLKMPEDVRPHLITYYFGEVDHSGHTYGPDSRENQKAVLLVDSLVGVMQEKVRARGLPVNFIFLADHGMTYVDTITQVNPVSLIDTSKFIICDGSTSMLLYAKDRNDIRPTYDLLKQKENGYIVYLREDIPGKWHYNLKDDHFDRIGDIYILPEHPKVLNRWGGRINPGTHGYDPVMKDMHAIFYAWGPQLTRGKQIGSFENVHVYPFVCRLLGLKYSHKIDGKNMVLGQLILPKERKQDN